MTNWKRNAGWRTPSALVATILARQTCFFAALPSAIRALNQPRLVALSVIGIPVRDLHMYSPNGIRERFPA